MLSNPKKTDSNDRHKGIVRQQKKTINDSFKTLVDATFLRAIVFHRHHKYSIHHTLEHCVIIKTHIYAALFRQRFFMSQ